MVRFSIICFILMSLSFRVCAQTSVDGSDKFDRNIPVPAAWIEKIVHFDYVRNDTIILRQFEDIIRPETIANPYTQHIDPDYGRVVNAMSVDLDGDGRDEIICLLGWDVISPYLCVFKQQADSWHLIYMEEIDTFYNSPTLSVANNFSPSKTFYLKRVYNHGSGVYQDGYNFYKLINGRIRNCFNLISSARIFGWGLFMNQEVYTSFEFSGDDGDGLSVEYHYKFFPGSIKKGDFSWDSHPEIPLISGDGEVFYKWDNKALVYKLDTALISNDPDGLTAQKIACFGDFGDDTLFVRAFNKQIKEALSTGTAEQKMILKKYLALVKKNKKATTAILEEKKRAGGTIFYGPKDGNK